MKLFEKLLKSIKASNENTNNEISSENIIKKNTTSKFQSIKEVTPEQIEAQEFYKQFTEHINEGHNLYLSTPIFISPLNKNGEIANNDKERVESVVRFTHEENDAICGKFDNKYYRFFEADKSLHIYYFENKEDELQTITISVNQNGNCIEHICHGENNSLIDNYQRMANDVDIRIHLADNAEIHFDDAQEQ